MTDYIDSATVYLDIRAGGWDGKVIPANDLFANATVLSTTLPGSRTGDTNKDSGWERGEVDISTAGYDHDVIGDQSVWYKFTPASSNYYQFNFTNIHWNGDFSFGFGAINVYMFHASTLAAMDPALGNYMQTGYSNPFGASAGNDIDFRVYLTAGETYYFKVTSNPNQSILNLNAQVCSWNLAWNTTSISPPANDDWADAATLGTTDTVTATTLDATSEEGERGSTYYAASQTVWYKIEPVSDCVLQLTIPYTSINGVGISSEYAWCELHYFAGATSQKDFSNSTYVTGSISADVGSTVDTTMIAALTGGETYYLFIYSPRDNGPFNKRAIEFDIVTTELPPVTNDDFADAEAISGASGSTEFATAGCTFQTAGSEPDSMYWNDPQSTGTVWFDWTCPTTGEYVFKVECTIDDDGSSGYSTAMPPNYDLAVWQGSTLSALTKVTRNWAGAENTEGRPYSPATAVGFSAVSGQHYKIQVANRQQAKSDTKLSWRTNTVTGDSTAAAVAFPNGRVDNYSNDASEPPPSYATILSTHDGWWYDDGQVGHVKWFKATYSLTQTIQIHGRQFNDIPDAATSWPGASDIGLIVYKGANYASLTPAVQTGGSNYAAMMGGSSGFFESGARHGWLTDVTGTKVFMNVDVTAGDVVWIALFGLYDNASWIDAFTDAEDATQFELDLYIPTSAPANDVWLDVWNDTENYDYNLSQGLYPPGGVTAGWYNPYAGQRDGTTVGATVGVGEAAIAGNTATRTVWYYWDPGWALMFDIWVESAVDCVLGIYTVNSGGVLASLVAQDDDSGPGNQPLLSNFVTPNYNYALAVVVDSKTEGAFTLKFRNTSLSPPANDEFANATVISSLPAVLTGTTIGATAEPGEGNAEELGTGPRDTVWYKYVATFNGHVKIKATCDTFLDDAYVYVDSWKGTTLANLVRNPEPPPTGPGGGINKGFFNHFNTPAQLESASFVMDVVSGQTYYIRVQTESGGSEDFTLYVDGSAVYLDITPSGADFGPYTDFATVYLDLTALGSDEFHGTIFDSGTVPLKLTPGATWETIGQERVDSATVYVDIRVLGGECFSRFAFTGEGEAETRWAASAETRWAIDTETRWDMSIAIQPGC